MRLQGKLLILLLLLAGVGRLEAGGFKPAHARKAMVVSIHPKASEAGLAMLKSGGNAVDAAVATGFALAVVHPAAGNLGGGGFMLVRFSSGKMHFLDYREKAPAAATAGMFLDEKGEVIPDASEIGYRAIAVPGSVAGMVEAQKRWGKLKLSQVMAPAIKLARKGFELEWAEETDFRRTGRLGQFPESRRVFQRDGRFYQQGEIFRQPELARTLKRIASKPGDFYKGALAKQLLAAVQKGGGLMTAADLAAYEVKEREPVRGSYRGYEIVSAPPPSSGGIALIEMLNILEGYDLGKLGTRGADSMHLTIEAMKRAFMDRAEFLGDPDFASIPVAQLIDKKYGAAWREELNPDKATPASELRRPATFNELDRVAGIPAEALEESGETTHYSVVDEQGNAVAVTTTLNDSFGSGVTAEGLGFLLNNEMDDFTVKPNTPNLYGLIQGPANAVGAGKRPLSAMTPTMVLKDGKLLLVMGSPGGPRIITTVLNVLLDVVDHGRNIQQAVAAPRFHHQWMPDHVRVERTGFSPDTLKLLEQRGHRIVMSTANTDSTYSSGYWSDAECIAIDAATGELWGGADPRNNGKAAGY